jgi:hypothetical protein
MIRDNTLPRCACGCGELATRVFDVHADGLLLERQPYADLACAIGATSNGTRLRIDELPTITLLLAARPCWCSMRVGAERAAGVAVDWCPRCGDSQSLARTQPMPVISMAELVEDGQ